MTLNPERKSGASSGTSPVPVGQLPPLGQAPTTVSAQMIRRDRYGDPVVDDTAGQKECS